MSGERGFSEDAEYLLSAGKKFFNIDDLIAFLKDNVEIPENAITETYSSVRNKIWEYPVDMDTIWKDIMSTSKSTL